MIIHIISFLIILIPKIANEIAYRKFEWSETLLRRNRRMI